MKIREYKEVSEFFPEEYRLFSESFFPVIMKWEGGSKLHKVSNDPGGWTKYGVAWNIQKHHFDSFEEFLNMTENDVKLFAFVNFYLKIRAHRVPYDVKLYYMDMAYNMGQKQAIKIFQRCAGVKADGIFGPVTESVSYKVTEYCLKLRRERFYYRLVFRKNKMYKFLRGWLNRSRAVFNYKY